MLKKKLRNRRVLLIILAIMLFVSVACAPKDDTNNDANAGSTNAGSITDADTGASQDSSAKSRPRVVATTSFLGDMTRVLAGDFVNIEVIIPAGDDPHLYVAKPEDHTKLQNADLVLYHGMHFEGKMVEILETMGKSVSENFPEEKIGIMDENGKTIIDPHFWFDIDLYKMATENAAKAIIDLIPEHKTEIENNLSSYLKELDDLAKYAKDRLAEIPEESRYLITPHDAFNYFSRYFGIEVHAPQGVSTDSEVAISDINETVDFIVEHKVKAIFAESTTDPARMKTIQEAVEKKGFQVKVVSGENHELFSDSLAPAGNPGDTYIEMYKHNIDLIVDNLK